MSESTVSDLVNRGILPKPISFTGGIVRWPWDDIVRALDSLKGGAPDETDPYLKAVKDAEKDKTE